MVELTHRVQSCSPVSADRNITTTTRCNMTPSLESNHCNIISTVRQQQATTSRHYHSTTTTALQRTSRTAEPLERTVMTISTSLQYYLIKITAERHLNIITTELHWSLRTLNCNNTTAGQHQHHHHHHHLLHSWMKICS